VLNFLSNIYFIFQAILAYKYFIEENSTGSMKKKKTSKGKQKLTQIN